MSQIKESCEAVQAALTLADMLARASAPGKAVVLLEFATMDEFHWTRRELLRTLSWGDFTDQTMDHRRETYVDRATVEYRVFGGTIRPTCPQELMHPRHGRLGAAQT
jgi:hypothetical protein